MNQSSMIILLVLSGIIAAMIASFMGLGGGLVLIPLLIVTVGNEVNFAKITSYLSIICLSIIAYLRYRKQKRNPEWRIGLLILLGALPATIISNLYIGNIFAENQKMYHTTYLIFTIIIASLIIFKKYIRVNTHDMSLPFLGIVAGFLSGTLGLSGGVLFIPILVIGKKLSIKNAAITSLFLKFCMAITNITIISINDGFANIHNSHVMWYFPLIVLIGTSFGAFVGPYLNNYFNKKSIDYLFYLLMLIIVINEFLKIFNVY